MRAEIRELFIECTEVKKKENYYLYGVGHVMCKPEIAKVAQEFYEENLEHLKGDIHWTPWAKEQWDYYWNKAFPSNSEDEQENSLNYIDGLEKEMQQTMANRFESAREDIRNSNNNAEQQIISQQLQSDITIFRQILNAISCFFKTIWCAVKWPFKKIGEIIEWLGFQMETVESSGW